MTLRSKAFVASSIVTLVFILSGVLFYSVQLERVNASEASLVRLISTTAANSIKRFQDRAVQMIDGMEADAITEDTRQRIAEQQGIGFVWLMNACQITWQYIPPQSNIITPQQQQTLAQQTCVINEPKDGVAFVGQTPFYTVVKPGKKAGELWVVGNQARSLFAAIESDYPLRVRLAKDTQYSDDNPANERLRGTVQLPGLLSNPINLWVEDLNFNPDSWPGKLILLSLLGLLTGIFLWWVWHSQLIKPLQHIIDQAKAINTQQNYQQRIQHQGDDELSELVSQYNSNISTLEYSYNLMMKSNLITTELISKVQDQSASVPQQPETNNELKYSLDMVNRLSDAVSHQLIELYYQPVFDLATRQVTQVEGMCRWLDDERGMVPPLDFFALAEKSGQMDRLTHTVIDLACASLHRWRSEWPEGAPLAINVSPSQFEQADLATIVKEAMLRYDIKPFQLEFEIKEYTIAEGMEDASRIIEMLDDLGVGICIDDFGLSQLSLLYLQRLPIRKIKLSKSFVDRLEASPEDAAFIKGIARFCEGLNVRAIAKGVQSQQQLQALQAITGLQCQGYALAKPMPDVEFREWLAS